MLIHDERPDEYGMPGQGFLAWGHGSTVYLGNVDDLPPRGRGRHGREAFEAHLVTLESVSYLSLDAILGDGWKVD